MQSNQNNISDVIFFEAIIARFPEMEHEVWDRTNFDLPHYDIARFSELSLNLIKESNWNKLKDYFMFLEEYIPRINSELILAIEVSYCEHLFTDGLDEEKLNKAIDYMGFMLREIFDKRKKWHESINK